MKIIFKLVVFMFLFINTKGQQILQGSELFEFAKIAEQYRSASNMTFNMNITYVDSAFSDSVLESMNARYILNEGQFWSYIDSVEFFEDDRFGVSVNYRDSIIELHKKDERNQILQLPVLDSLFREASVASVVAEQINDSTNKIKFQFLPDSHYNSYEITYHNTKLLIRTIKMVVKDYSLLEDGGSGVSCITMQFENYSFDPVDMKLFNRFRFLTLQGVEYIPKSQYAGFEVINKTGN